MSLPTSGAVGAHPGFTLGERFAPMLVFLLVAAAVVFVVRLAVSLTRRTHR